MQDRLVAHITLSPFVLLPITNFIFVLNFPLCDELPQKSGNKVENMKRAKHGMSYKDGDDL